MHYCQHEGHHISISHPLSISQSAVRIRVIWPIRGQHHPLWASWALHTLLFIMKMKLVHGSKQKFIPPWYLEYHVGVEEQARNFDKEEKFRTKLFSTEMNLNNVSLTIGKGWCMMHKWTLNLNLHPSLLSFADGSFWTTQPQNASLPLNSKIGNLTQIDILWRGCFLCLMAVRFPVWRPLSHQPPLAPGDLWWYLHLDYIPLRRPSVF